MKNLLKKYLSWSSKEKWLFWQVLLRMIQIKTQLRFKNFETFKKWYAELDTEEYDFDELKQAIQRAATVSPKHFTCLPQALVFKKMARPYNVILVIGVQASEKMNLDAHAWCEQQGKVLIGDVPDFQYLPLWIWE
ncbi:lasso peptide biosynthesis B2 protein [Jiulongibacter sp. NS-SX5]|uniref:lasso peptide biosynthesis B2 protein n=1 Tax=Jiulongibacter sp. NS-SX5 TaxID=3463854 RepID=UPI004057E74D